MSLLDWALVLTTLVAAVWWIIARRRQPVALDVLSLVALALAVLTFIFDGQHWQLVPWQVIALVAAASAGLRRWRPGMFPRWIRVIGRLALILGLLLGGLALLTVSVPSLPQPSGPYLVGSQIFRWTDDKRPEAFTADPQDKRQVVAQAWYPADATQATQMQRVPYLEAQGRLPGSIFDFPPFFYSAFAQVDTHATMFPPVSTERPSWPVLLFLTGLWEDRESYTALCTDLASRGYVVVALSAPYESAVTVLADGQIVGTTLNPFGGNVTIAQLIDARAADSSFVMDQLLHFAQIEPGSPLTGHLDSQHVGIVGHSLGGATASQVIDHDPRFQLGVNMDGALFGTQPTARLNRPFLWLQSDGYQSDGYIQGRDQLLGGLRQGGELLIVGGSLHEGFTDFPSYLSSTGRALLGGITNSGSVSLSDMTAMTGGSISAFAGPLLNGPTDPTLDQVIARYPAIKHVRHITAVAAK